jgi:ABC-2 type transport system ATP-binding protein
MHEPDILFLDEPTSNLDPQSRLFVWERVRQLNASGITVLLTTHDMDEAERLCDRIAIMDRGKVLVNDTSANLKKLIPGGTVLVVHVYGDPDVKGSLQSALSALCGATKVDTSNNSEDPRSMTFRVYADSATALIGPAVQATLLAGAEVRDLSVKHPTLEEVFIFLTGRNLRQ